MIVNPQSRFITYLQIPRILEMIHTFHFEVTNAQLVIVIIPVQVDVYLEKPIHGRHIKNIFAITAA